MNTKANSDKSLQLAFTAQYMLAEEVYLNFVIFQDDKIVQHRADVAMNYKHLAGFERKGDNIEWGLELLHLTDISNEHLIEVNKIVAPRAPSFIVDEIHKRNMVSWLSTRKDEHGMNIPFYRLSKAEHYLRSQGYALTWNGITVEEQYRLGWIRFKRPKTNESVPEGRI